MSAREIINFHLNIERNKQTYLCSLKSALWREEDSWNKPKYRQQKRKTGRSEEWKTEYRWWSTMPDGHLAGASAGSTCWRRWWTACSLFEQTDSTEYSTLMRWKWTVLTVYDSFSRVVFCSSNGWLYCGKSVVLLRSRLFILCMMQPIMGSPKATGFEYATHYCRHYTLYTDYFDAALNA